MQISLNTGSEVCYHDRQGFRVIEVCWEKLKMLKKTIIALLVIGVFVLVGCGTSGPEKADSIEGIVGTWERIGGLGPTMYLQAFEDGTIHMSTNPDQLEVARPVVKWETRFEGTQLLIKESIGYCNDPVPVTGIYEANILENGNLGFVAIDDECAARITALHGVSGAERTIEYEPFQ